VLTHISGKDPNHHDELEILSVRLLDDHRPTISAITRLARKLRIGLGWHYLLDLAWMLARIDVERGSWILDAGAGRGILQWYLCESGMRIISVDRNSRAVLPLRLRARYRVSGQRTRDLAPISEIVRAQVRQDGFSLGTPARFARDAIELISRRRRRNGEVVIYNEDLSHLTEISDGSVDAVIAVSALEHNDPDQLEVVVAELMRVLKPGGRLVATLGAARGDDWFHEPSRGWCYSATTLRRIFNLSPDTRTNYDQYDRLLDQLRSCAELRDNLAAFYFRSGDNGMPWGIWDPAYQPVGVSKIKS
jgi:SAM-dependent methyltransferase